jgi:hypothetical protein
MSQKIKKKTAQVMKDVRVHRRAELIRAIFPLCIVVLGHEIHD